MGSNQETQIDARERLIVAAQALYAEAGVAATTPRQVLQRSGVGQGSLYHHFPSKRDLARAAVERTTQEQLRVAEGVLIGDLAAHERVRAYLLRDRNALAGCRIGRLTSDQAVVSDESLLEPVEGYFAGLIDLLSSALEESGTPRDRAQDRAAAIVAVVQGGYVLARATGDPERMRSAVRGMAALLDGDQDDH
ncbi:MAG: TetR/AcrR family transcriptional regulator [Rhodoglobus sp.]